MPRVVYASCSPGFDPSHATVSSHRCCAERNLLDYWKHVAIKHGIGRHRIIPWIKRKLRHIHIFRISGDGDLCKSYPCIFCRREIEKYDLHCTCIDASGNINHKLRAEQLPRTVFTSSQKKLFNL